MAYSKKRTSRKSVKSRSMKKTMASKTRPMSDKQKALQTGYAKALINPQTGPLVGVPTFVPIDTHRVRSKCCGTISLNGSGRIFFNPLSMGANDYRSIRAFGVDSNTGTVLDGGSFTGLFSNAPYSKDDYMVTSLVADNIHVTQSDIDNNDGVRSRVVGASFTVRPISNSQVRDGVLIALHEKHHKTLETFTGGQMAAQDNAIIKSCSSGNAVTLLYRPVKPEEVDEFQLSANRLNGHISVNSGDGDGALFDGYPGYMAVEWTGSGIQNFWVEAHAIVEYAGEIVTTLAKPPHHGDPKKAEPNDIPHVGRQVTMVEASQQA